jgi:hypothetical protein
MRWLLFALKFFFLSFFFIVSTLNLPLSEEGNFGIVLDEYQGWAYSVGSHLGTLTGYIVKVEWLPQIEDAEKEDVIEAPRFTKVRR